MSRAAGITIAVRGLQRGAWSQSAVHCCPPALAPPGTVFDITTTYHLPGGDIVNQGRWSGMPDLSQPGFALTGTRADHDTIVSGTGGYSGARGRVNGWGVVDVHALPGDL